MSFQPSPDFLADYVVDEVPVSVRASMSEPQIRAVREAASKRHKVDVRFVLPLIFTNIYFVLLVGKDTRFKTLDSAREQRAQAGSRLSAFGVALLAATVVVTGAIVLYVVKSRAGIDLFPGHAREIVGR